MYRAMSRQTIRYNPFEDAKYERVERKIRCLGKADVARLLIMPLQNEQAEFVRRIFLFSVFTGLAFADVTFGTLTLEAGVPIESIGKMMGHSFIASTQSMLKSPAKRFQGIWIG